MRSSFLVLSVLLHFATCVSAQEKGILKGTIHSVSGEPVAYAAVGLLETSYGIQTDTAGNFAIQGIEPGRYRLKVSSVGHFTYEQHVEITSAKTTFLKITLEEMENSADEVVVTGSMQESYKATSVTPVEIYTAKFFQKSPSPNLFYALQMVNGVRPQLNCNVCNTGDIHINGMEGPYTMVMIDGMPIVSSLSTVYGLMGIPNGIVERIEVVKGPASTLYGSEAVAGVVNVITKTPTKAPTLYLDANGSSWGEANTDLSVKWKAGKITSLSSLNYFNFQNRIDKNHDGFTDMTLQNRISFFNKISVERKENRLASIGVRLFYEDRFGGQLDWQKEHRGGNVLYGESIYTKRAELIGAYQFPLKKENLIFYYSYNYHDQNSAYGTTWFLATQHVAFGQLVWTKTLGKSHNLVAGGAFRYTAYLDNTAASLADDGAYKTTVTQLPGLFAQDEISISPKSKLLLGSRLDHHPVHGFIATPRIGYKFQPNRTHSIRLNTGNGFRVVNVFTEDHAALTGSRKVVFAEKIQPEKSWNANLNYTGYFAFSNGFLSVDGSLFYNYFTNKIVPDYLSDADKIIYKNISGHAINRGASLSLDLNFTNSFKVQLAGTLLEAFKTEQDSTGTKINTVQLHTPNFQGNMVVSYTIPYLHIVLDYTSQVYSPMKLPVYPEDYRPEFSPWFSLHNIQASRTHKYLTVYLGVKNIFDFVPANPILRPFDPFDKQVNDPVNNPHRYTFDPTYNYAPLQGVRAYAGLRIALR